MSKRYTKNVNALSPEDSEISLERTAKKLGCTAQGIVWMKNALDPFPDVKRDIVGYPDTIKTPSIVQYFREEVSVATPSIGGLNWDCNVYHPGYYGNGTAQSVLTVIGPSGNPVGINSATLGASSNCGGIEVRAAATGTPLSRQNIIATIPETVSLDLQNRLVAYGFEVFNTTPELYRSGSVTAWRQPPLLSKEQIIMIANGGLTPSAAMYNFYNDPPNTSSLALNLEGSLEWDADEGAYCVATQSEATNQPQSVLTEVGNLQLSNGIYYTDPITLKSSFVLTPNGSISRSPYDQFGAFFTGLNTNSTLKIVKHYLIERFPTYTNADLVTLARPTPPYDPRVQELYTQIASFLPTGVPVEDNFLGAFLQGLATVARAVAPVVIPAIANAISGSISKKSAPKEESKELVLYRPEQKNGSFVETMSQAMVPIAEKMVTYLPHQQQQSQNQLVTREAVRIDTRPQNRTIGPNVYLSSSNNRSAAAGKGKRQRGKRLLDSAFSVAH
jgi:hypothetical protein